MLTVTCIVEHLCDGSIRLTPEPSPSADHSEPVRLVGPHVELWNALELVSKQPKSVQIQLLNGLADSDKEQAASALAEFSRLNLIRVESPTEGPVLARLHKLHLELTHRCNFRCRTCYLGERLLPASSRSATEGTTEQWMRVIRDAAELGCSFATVTGGEPLLRRDALEILACLSEERIAFELNTNGTCITDEVADRLAVSTVESVEISLYGSDATSVQNYAGNRGGFAAAMAAIKRLATRRIPLQVKYFTIEANEQSYGEVAIQLNALGVPHKQIGHAIHGDIFDGKLDPGFVPASSLKRPTFVQNTQLPCGPSLHGLGIEPNGDVRACPKLTVYFGNVFRDGLHAIWADSNELDSFREFWPVYCRKNGYVKGARVTSRCPAANMLSRSGGLDEFRAEWQVFRTGVEA